MRTTLTIDDRIARDLKELAHRSGKPFKTVVNETLQAGLAERNKPGKAKRYRLKPMSLGSVRPGLNLDQALALSDSLEDEELIRKMELRK
ncbi:MAG TPA: DUF2191 domain-containing protein [Thermoanaerobaculia bacterium]|nr:DUF2191 domain-containing protein [Thermoanaerobaculia bacterium]